MAGIGDTGGGGKRGLNPEVNLVPFIDLLSVCICFLLVSAVWLQLGTVQVKQSLGTEAPVESKDQFDLTIQFITPFTSRVLMQQKGATLTSWEVNGDSKESYAIEFDKLLDEKIQTLSKTAGAATLLEAKDIFGSATVVPAVNVPYKSLVLAMDILRKRQVINLAVMPKAG